MLGQCGVKGIQKKFLPSSENMGLGLRRKVVLEEQSRKSPT